MKSTVVIAPYSKYMRNNEQNPKNFPHFAKVTGFLASKGLYIVQVGGLGEVTLTDVHKTAFGLSMKSIEELVRQSMFFISVDNFLHHLAYHVGKRGIVIWGQSDPSLFGYPFHTNVLKSRDNLRPNQFDMWESVKFNPDTFPTGEEVCNIIAEKYNL